MKIVIPKQAIDAMRNGTLKKQVFDWKQAALVIRNKNPKIAFAYLKTQRDTTGGVIYRNGEPVCDSYTFLQSDWDIPMLECDGVSQECAVDPAQTPDEWHKRWDGRTVYRALGRWNAFTKWPKSALDILEATKEEM